MITDNGPDYTCRICGMDTLGEIGHNCATPGLQPDGPGEEDGPWAEGWEERSGVPF